ncbi:MAG: TfoX family protein [Chitinophagaceae bacterium]|nr:MAG: TfoX family protein [Chitinophagaceae bacterium]
MATDSSFVDFVVEHIRNAGEITARKMFGEYALYTDGKVFAFVCDNQLLIKPTEAGRTYIGDVTEGAPYPGAKPYLLISEDQIENAAWLSRLVRVTAAALPEPKPKKKK